MKIISNSPKETFEFAKKFAETVVPGSILALHGELGSGKTSFTKGLASGLGVKDEIKSPTFTLMNVYQTANPTSCYLVHFDTYRLTSDKQFIEIGGEEYLENSANISVVEWPEKIQEILKNKKVTNIFFRHLSENTREISTDNI